MPTIVITGAGRGIGLATCKEFLRKGYQVIATYRSAEGLAALQALSHQVGQLQCFPLEVSDSHAIQDFAEKLRDQTVDILLNNAGVFGGEAQSINHLDFNEWKQTLAINTIAPIELTLALLPNLRKSSSARVVAISSQMASLERNQPGYYAYRSSKAALNKAVQCLAHDLKTDNIVVCPVHPGWVQTGMGGAHADISVDECVAGLVPLIEQLSMAQTGRFLQYNGESMRW
jgi:NAD(P)-dependent dehydrogenase (short-subunit alcohol dehydrogenase family)